MALKAIGTGGRVASSVRERRYLNLIFTGIHIHCDVIDAPFMGERNYLSHHALFGVVNAVGVIWKGEEKLDTRLRVFGFKFCWR